MKKEYYLFLYSFLVILCSIHSMSNTRQNSSLHNQTLMIQESKADKVEKNYSTKKLDNNEEKTKRELETCEEIEIFVDLTAISKEFNSRNLYRYLKLTDIEEAVNEVTRTLKNLICVKIKGERKLKISSATILSEAGFTNNSYYNTTLLNSFIEADLIILIRYSNSNDRMNSTIFAKPNIIQNDQSNNERPQVGTVILYPEFNLTENNKKEYLKFLFLHEFTHILGFFPHYLDKIPHGTDEIQRIRRGMYKNNIKSERVLEHARTYFDCQSMQYLELEDQSNFEDLNNCHWDARVLLGEYMTSQPYFGDQVISEFTLLLLEDLGYYETKKYTGGLMKFGKKRGCEFLGYSGTSFKDPTWYPSLSDCLTPGDSGFYVPLSKYEFCTGINAPTCSSGRQSRTYCVKSTEDRPSDEYIRSAGDLQGIWGRADADYCPVSDAYKEDIVRHYVGNCNIGNDNYGTNIMYDATGYDSSIFDVTVGQIYSNNSFCALSSLVHKTNDTKGNLDKYKERIRPTCYPMFCSSTSLTVLIYQQYLVCPQEGGIMEISNYNGYIYCPDYNLICTGTEFCNNMFDCVDKKSTAKSDLNYTINSRSDGSVIRGVDKDNEIKTYRYQIVKGYELSDDDKAKCPKNCSQCIEKKKCFECKEGTFYNGTRENDENPIKCESEQPNTTLYHYLNENYIIANTKLSVFFNCMEGCRRCNDGDSCEVCDPRHYKNKITNNCDERIPHCLEYIESGPSVKIEDDEIVYTECKQCDNNNSYYCRNIKGQDDLKNCYLIEDLTQYYKDSNCYVKCDERFQHCLKCDSTRCSECKKGYYMKNDGKCILNVTSLITDGPCIIEINTISDLLSETLITDLVEDYIENIELSTTKIGHYINKNKDFSVTIFINSSCTEGLLKSGYFSIDDEEITEKMINTMDTYFEKDDPAITAFISYGVKNYSLMIFTFGVDKISLDECSQCQNMEVKIKNNFTEIINKTLGGLVLDVVKNGEFDIFDENAGEFTTLCKNVSLLGVDIPFYKRKNYFYMHRFSNAYSCRADICLPTQKLFPETTTNCVCSLPETIDYNLIAEEFTFYNISSSKGNKAGDAFKIFGCVEDAFDSKHIKANFGFYISIISIILQCILFVVYACVGKQINFSKSTAASISAPPKRVHMKINADWIKANLLNDHDEEKDIQSKDEIDDEFVMEEFNYNIDKHDTSSYSVDTDLAKKHISDNKDTEKDGLAEKPDGKKKKKILILLPDKTQKDVDSDKLDDDFPPGKDKKQDKNFFQIYWIILSLKQHIINYFSGLNCLKITESYVPKLIMGIRSLFMIVFVFFVNAMFLSQDYYDKKFEHFNEKYRLIPAYDNIKISGGEKFNYGFGHTASNAFFTFLIYLAVQLIFGLFVFSVRKELTELFNTKDVLKINTLAKSLKATYIIYFVIVIILMIAFFIYLTSFNGVYVGSGNDFGPAGLLSLIFIEIFPFIWSLILAVFRYFGIKCQNKVLYGISQVFMF